MATVKVVLRKKKLANNTYPLAIRITKDRKTSFIHIGQDIRESDWDSDLQRVKKSHANSARLNNFIMAKLAEANDKALELETTKKVVSAKVVRQKIKPKAGDTVFNQADLYISRLKEDGKYNRWNSEKSNVKHLKDFLKTDIAFAELTQSVLKRFKASLISKRGVSERTAINNWVTIRSIFSQAIAEGACEEKYYPFGKKKLQIKFPDSKKVGLTKEDVQKIENATIENPKADHARNLWLLSYYFAGMRISDVLRLQWSDFVDGRMYYAMGKNNKGDSLKVPEKVQVILSKYEALRSDESELIFLELRKVNLTDRFQMERIISSRNNAIDRLLKKEVSVVAKVKKPLSMHISQHSFATIAGDKIPLQMLQKLYRHTDIKTTIGYQANFIHSDVDDALDAVLGK